MTVSRCVRFTSSSTVQGGGDHARHHRARLDRGVSGQDGHLYVMTDT